MLVILLGIASFIFWRWVLRKFISNPSKRKVFIWIATLVTTPVAWAAVMAVFIWAILHEPSSDFDKTEWKKAKVNQYEMADDLIESNRCIGQDTAQLKQLIGEPTWRDTKANRWVYHIGSGGGGLGFLHHNLLVTFKNNRVLSVVHERLPN
ncbi:hypothetical protein LGH70_07925 [Hymenobacter sp. BT635]|uniref:Uncharacterized protein n=1 Tax=Hymenobacter nitidus TaxID=2880929 RepID=A0ABS8AAT3_9BACT|nr:hypothetical protein [Hymenobacter nitidus]MCB2377505.1 hypothetical protein [Hymenobacter nitidus]